jgi:PAS domain S-box-containing protein
MNSAALRVLNRVPAMIAYWDKNQKCVLANAAYREWFGKESTDMSGISIEELLGPEYRANLPYILGALSGSIKVVERQIPLPNGQVRESVATYLPDRVDGSVVGFVVHVTDITPLKHCEQQLEDRERRLTEAVHDTIQILEKTKRSFRSKELGALRARLEKLNGSAATSVQAPAPVPTTGYADHI